MNTTHSQPNALTDKPTVVLVHGAWHGGWCWQRVVPLLQAQGLATHALTLTGVGERAHLLSGQIRLSTHIADVLGLIDTLELGRVLLVGHSYGGLVITGVADALLKRNPSATLLNGLVYVDAVTPHPGESWSSQHTPETVVARVALAADKGAGIAIPPPDASVFGLEGEDRDWVNRRQTPQPFRLYQAPLAFDPALVWAIPHSFIDCTNPPLPTIDASRKRVRSEAGWTVYELATGHDPMVSAPRELVQLLLKVHSSCR